MLGMQGSLYTPRGVTNFVIDRLQPKLGEKIGDFACGTGGFLISALENNGERRKNLLLKI